MSKIKKTAKDVFSLFFAGDSKTIYDEPAIELKDTTLVNFYCPKSTCHHPHECTVPLGYLPIFPNCPFCIGRINCPCEKEKAAKILRMAIASEMASEISQVSEELNVSSEETREIYEIKEAALVECKLQLVQGTTKIAQRRENIKFKSIEKKHSSWGEESENPFDGLASPNSENRKIYEEEQEEKEKLEEQEREEKNIKLSDENKLMIGKDIDWKQMDKISQRCGAIPFTVTKDNNLLFCVGMDARHNEWTDFGGRFEKSDSSRLAAAARELEEESRNVLDCYNPENFKSALCLLPSEEHKHIIVFPKVDKKYVESSMITFKQRRNINREMKEIAWMTEQEFQSKFFSIDKTNAWDFVRDHFVSSKMRFEDLKKKLLST